MVFESVRGYVQLASGLSELTRARATEAAHGLLSLQGSGIETGSKLAVQVSALAEELLAAATANRHNLTTLVRTEVDAAVNRIGLVPAEQLQESQAELAALRAELAALRASLSRGTAAKKAAVKKTAAKKTAAKKAVASKAAVKKSAAKRSAAKKTSAVSAVANPVTMTTATRRSAVTTRREPAGA
jgi:peptidoglycan hydrolase CwlO-like protein